MGHICSKLIRLIAFNNRAAIPVLPLATLIIFLGVPACVVASEISGTVVNKTTTKSAAGDEVILLSLSQGMQETARTKTDANGKFKLQVPDEGVQHLIRVVHQGVNYHKPAPQGTSTIDVEVFDVARQVDKIFGEGRILRLQTANEQLQVSEMYILRNESTPPRTRMSDRSFELVLPDGAELEGGMAAGPGGMPVTSVPVPTEQKNHYASIFPIRPGRTQLQVTYHLAYTGSYTFHLTPDISIAELGVMLPKSMKFKAAGDAFQQAVDESGLSTFVAKSVSPGQDIAFTVSGEGTAPGNAGEMPSEPSGGGADSSLKGENAVSGTSTWYVVGAIAIAIAAGAYFIARRPIKPQQKASVFAAAASASEVRQPTVATGAISPPTKPASLRSTAMLELLKEELFQIETERLEGKISEQQYAEIKRGIDALMRRHVGQNQGVR